MQATADGAVQRGIPSVAIPQCASETRHTPGREVGIAEDLISVTERARPRGVAATECDVVDTGRVQ